MSRSTYKPLIVLATSMVLALLVAVVSVTVFTPTNAQAAQAKTCGGGNIKLKPAEKSILAKHNRVRTARDKPRLCIHPKLQRAARQHARDMLQRDYFSHTTKGSGDTLADRIREQNYRYRTIGENIAWGSGTKGMPANIHQNWMQSPGHRKNILNGSFRQVGIGMALGNFKGYSKSRMYVADFGTRR